ncbi:hypothetical protein EDF64_12028 [Curtobacterium flaccumfaciens]|uniref:HEPN AbiJ-N-terminal domain-containing protein n=1 Tax=Curtobacterium flaccumfaciens TaxID=2035 RepID=A0A4R6DB09_9MICO|nr:hypothetical protein [Curtobacterium flaccumfaciens]TDN41453.1 hypothetical protein EDF64_12028 [Curtobacterium flaccumfaciens]
MPSFSERNGFTPSRTIVQLNDLDSDTRTRIWNVVHIVVVKQFNENGLWEEEEHLLDNLWVNFLRQPVDERPSTGNAWRILKGNLTASEFPRVMDLLEALVSVLPNLVKRTTMQNVAQALVTLLNETFEEYLVGYRFVGKLIMQIDSAEEVAAIEGALTEAKPLAVAHQHLSQALAHLVDRGTPDYRNVIKESVQAVESAAITLTGETKFSAAVRALPDVGLPSHRALLSSWEKMYGWASDEDGLRHGGEKIIVVDQALAKYVFGISASFVAYLVEKARQAGSLA